MLKEHKWRSTGIHTLDFTSVNYHELFLDVNIINLPIFEKVFKVFSAILIIVKTSLFLFTKMIVKTMI